MELFKNRTTARQLSLDKGSVFIPESPLSITSVLAEARVRFWFRNVNGGLSGASARASTFLTGGREEKSSVVEGAYDTLIHAKGKSPTATTLEEDDVTESTLGIVSHSCIFFITSF